MVNGLTRDPFTERQLLDYMEYKRDFVQWLYRVGKEPERVEGYAHGTVRQASQKPDQLYRRLWDERGSYTTDVTPEDADDYLHHLDLLGEGV